MQFSSYATNAQNAPAVPSFDVEGATPMMQQYMQLKMQYPDCMLFYRMGDFYELFFNDAVNAAEALDITLTKRGTHKGEDIPMCGVPWHSHESYLARLIRRGYKVAICEQVETPEEAKKRGGHKALVKRDVVRVVTQGTLTEDGLLDKASNNYLASVVILGGTAGIALVDLSTGDFVLCAAQPQDVLSVLSRYAVAEVLIADKTHAHDALEILRHELKQKLTIQPAARFDAENGRKRVETAFGVGTLDAFGGFSRAEVAAAGAAIDYIALTQKGKFPRLSPPRQVAQGSVMDIDMATRRNLELTSTLQGERNGSLLHAIDRTVTGAGGRMMQRFVSSPLTDIVAINARLDASEFLSADDGLRNDIRQRLRSCGDIERSLSRLSLDRGGPRDLAVLRDTLMTAADISQLLRTAKTPLPALLQSAADDLAVMGAHHPLINELSRALKDEMPVLTRDGGFIAKGYHPQLDEFTTLRDDSKRVIARLQDGYSRDTGITGLKIKHNNILGYFIEVTANHADKLLPPGGAKEGHPFIHRQTMANAARFTTVELSELERKIVEAADRALGLELELFSKLCADVMAQAAIISRAADALAMTDVMAGNAAFARAENCVRPVLTEGMNFAITGGRHPVVEHALRQRDNAIFIANNCTLETNGRVWLLTGPNMAGKSTFLRQNALIALMAQAGCFVPAQSACIGVIDRLFSRVGAADDLARGRSTFMVEMVETAAILNQASERSLVILDEIGRGTATFDGLSIAWATLEYIVEKIGCRGLFATHYHELTSLCDTLSALSCHTMKVREWNDEIVFLHEVGEGTADRSYGIHVAKIAGLPPVVVARAQAVLATLENEKSNETASAKTAKAQADLPLFNTFAQTLAVPAAPEPSEADKLLSTFDPDSMTPRDALEAMYALKARSKLHE